MLNWLKEVAVGHVVDDQFDSLTELCEQVGATCSFTGSDAVAEFAVPLEDKLEMRFGANINDAFQGAVAIGIINHQVQILQDRIENSPTLDETGKAQRDDLKSTVEIYKEQVESLETKGNLSEQSKEQLAEIREKIAFFEGLDVYNGYTADEKTDMKQTTEEMQAQMDSEKQGLLYKFGLEGDIEIKVIAAQGTLSENLESEQTQSGIQIKNTENGEELTVTTNVDMQSNKFSFDFN